ncbi:PREDICTED: uncharacterized protein LOC108759349, partial [Trachymyrmex cornetzi]|uniref:uncharacterized protein LOC108759349 n=1 Tax=Trachymyrmex cornetzi TaxID=471704 RepID=UPI00084F70E1
MGAVVISNPSKDQFLSSFFLIKKSSGGMRFILNLRDLNAYILPPHFKMEDWHTVVRLMLPNYRMASVDLQDTYLAIPIHPLHRKFLRFQWRGVVYEFTALPFGLATAPYIFTKITRPIVTILRKQGFQSVVYLDDFLLLGASEEECRENVNVSLELLSRLGFLVNYAKSQMSPSHTCKYLGFVFDSVHQSLSIPHDKRQKLLLLMLDMLKKAQCSIREFASMIGSLIFCCPAVQYGIFYIKRFEREKFLALGSDYQNYDRRMVIPTYLKEDFEWWIRIFSNTRQANTICTDLFRCEIYSDASITGWGASCGELHTHGWWSTVDASLHINALELKAAYYALRSIAVNLKDCNILLRVDNTTAIAYINNFGSVQYPVLSDLARDIWKWCEDRNIYLFASYIASVDNVIADTESRRTNVNTEWSLSTQAFNLIDERFGLFDIDLFTSAINSKNNLYVSWLPDPGSWATDAFILSWNSFYFYAFLSFILIPRILSKIIDEGTTGVLETSSRVEEPFPGGREIIRKAFQSQAVPSTALDTLIASLAPSTINQYARPLRDWWNFCQTHGVSLFSPAVDQVLTFLAQELQKVGSYSTLNTTRSAVSLISEHAIGNHPLVKRFCKGASSIKPQSSRYDFVWDPAPVISKLATIYPYDPLPLEIITRKLVLLLALGSGQRAQSPAAIRISFISFATDRLTIRIPDRIKTSAPGRAQPLITFIRFRDPELCIISILQHYLSITRDLRPNGSDTLFIACVKPHMPVGIQTVSRWIRKGLEECGIQGRDFSAHSTHHASTSLAAKKGVPIDLIKRAAGWS